MGLLKSLSGGNLAWLFSSPFILFHPFPFLFPLGIRHVGMVAVHPLGGFQLAFFVHRGELLITKSSCVPFFFLFHLWDSYTSKRNRDGNNPLPFLTPSLFFPLPRVFLIKSNHVQLDAETPTPSSSTATPEGSLWGLLPPPPLFFFFFF